MARVPLSKSQLRKEKDNLTSYRRYLPALDLKRQQLMSERVRAARMIGDAEAKVAGAAKAAGDALPMLADERIDVSGLVTLGEISFGVENVAGIRLPVIEKLEIIEKPYGRMVRPHWVDAVVARLAEAIRLRIEVDIAQRRLAILEKAVATITQRVNLFDKVLIPEAEANIRRINVYLGDNERAAVVAGKIAKRSRAAAGGAP